MNLNLKQTKKVSELKLFTRICLTLFTLYCILCTCTCITYKTKVNSDISMVIYSQLFLFLLKRKKGSPTSFPPVTSTNVGFGPQNFLTFSFKPFATLVQNFKFVPSAIPKLLNFNEDHPSKKAIFLVKSL